VTKVGFDFQKTKSIQQDINIYIPTSWKREST